MIKMKTINVVAAIIVHEGRIFATQRGYGEWKGWWEFPGGKVEPGERPEEALEHDAAAWLDQEHLRSVQWLPADETIIGDVERLI